ncbi:ABC transporter ATP-binding protein [Fimbriiglobus ruber]|uniref:ABC transporter, ATP-binding protein n=1 Tax=Fimbriiglobus ruber TaxID=1908690 RepID=A0A225DYW4_9BACT|nr:ABC transporter ATP-binding protein [Fimbriiglobus ruber]OWK46541.1 ABC transporter, ATP-binding protein [Fimbriiglobus ruber]
MAHLSRFLSPLTRFRGLFSRKPARANDARSAVPAIRKATGPTLEATGLLRSFGSGSEKTFALQNVSIELRSGELNLLMGPSGSGKSTLLAVISALLRPDAGHVRAMGQDIWRMNETELERFRLRHCSYIFQGYNLFPALTARQQLEVVLQWGEGAGRTEARKRADRVLGQLGLANKAHLRPASMSGGEKQRVAIARALVKNPSFVFADEPTSALDWDNGQQVIGLLNEISRERGATVLVVTHDHRLVPFADRVFEMSDGRLQLDAPAAPDTGVFYPDQTLIDICPPHEPRLRLREPVYVNTH